MRTLSLKATVAQNEAPVWVLTEEQSAKGPGSDAVASAQTWTFSTRDDVEAELGRRYVGNLDQQRLFDGESLTLWV